MNCSTAQHNDPTVQQIVEALEASANRPHSTSWQQQPLLQYKQLWSQLKLIDGIVYRQYWPEPALHSVTVPILPTSLQKQALQQNHDVASAGHQGSFKTLRRLRQKAYWVNMTQDVDRYCRECTKCQQSKFTAPTRAPLTNVPIGRPWQMVAIDILEVPVSLHDNRYLLVVQDYFTKWAEAIPMPDQKASRITCELVRLFSTMGIPQMLHSDQGRNFESMILSQTLEAFGISKTRTTAYHPQGDGMVERFNRSLLQLLRVYTDIQAADWEHYLPLVLYAYRTAVHSSTGVTPFQMMFGRVPREETLIPQLSFQPQFQPQSYQAQLQAKFAELQDMVETHIVDSAMAQKVHYDARTSKRSFQLDDLVWLSVPTAGKLDLRWEGCWKIKSIKNALNMEITDGRRSKVVHVNRLRHRIQPCSEESSDQPTPLKWNPNLITHMEEEIKPPSRYPSRIRRPPNRYGT